jgi:uncharacterized protein (TIGR03435 family)
VFGCILALTPLSGEGQAQNAAPARFEVESIKRNVSDGPSFLATKGDRFSATNFPLRLLILNSFRLQPNQLIGGPNWLDEHYDVIAKSPEQLTPDRQREMIRVLLADRFSLVATWRRANCRSIRWSSPGPTVHSGRE